MLFKRTYVIVPGEECVPDATQVPLRHRPRYADDGVTLEEDTDLWPIKRQTDVVVRGHVYNHPGQRAFPAGIAVGATRKVIRVSGDRRCTTGPTGKVLFSDPALVEELPLSYALAYGGKDVLAERSYGNPVEVMAQYLPPGGDPALVAAASPFFYPRNPGGRGYLVEATRGSIEALALPNLEHPEDSLSPDRLAAGETSRWAYQPVPASLGWLDYGAFPRLAWFGVLPEHENVAHSNELGEVRLGYCGAELFDFQDDATPSAFSLEGVQGASLGLRVPALQGGERVELDNLSRWRKTVSFRLPARRPKLFADARNGGVLPTEPAVMHSIVVEPDALRVSIVWRGSTPARRPYGAEELMTMPYAVEA